jgi:aminoglycoside phosphotransferase
VTALPAPTFPEMERIDVTRLLGRGTRTITVAASRDPNAKVTVLLFRPGAVEPTLAVKIPTTAAASLAIEAEARVLARLPERLTPRLQATVPQVVALLPSDHGRAMVTTALPGTPMTTTYHRWRHVNRRASVAHDLTVAGRWLTRVQTVTATEARPVEFVRSLLPPLTRRFSTVGSFDLVVRRLESIDRQLRQVTGPRTVVHGDYWLGNVLTDGSNATGVVDWEGAAETGEPIRDVVRFSIAYALYLDRHTRPGRVVSGHRGLRAGEWGAGLRFALDGRGWFPHLLSQFVAGHLRRLGMAPELWRDVLLAGIAECASAADEPTFARHHFDLLAELCCTRTGLHAC